MANKTVKNVYLDDMILSKDMPTTAGSKMLDGYMSLFDAEVITKLKDAGYTDTDICRAASTGEFGLDLLGETNYKGINVDSGIFKNPVATEIEACISDATVVLDVNGWPRRAAALSSLVYVKPTYGTVSRYGTIPAVCSGECVGVMARDAAAVREVLSVIAGHDDKDGTSLPADKCGLLKSDAPRDEVKKIAVAKSLTDLADNATKAKIADFTSKAKALGIEVDEIDADKFLLAKSAWNVLMSAEVCNNVSRYDGVKFGYRSENYTNIDELYTNSRTESFGYLTKSTILYGSEVLSDDNYMPVYDKSLRIRRVLSEYMAEILAEYDAILAPAASKQSFTAAEVQENKYIAYDESVFTAPASITGLPTAVFAGVQLIGKTFSENSLLDLCEKF